MHSSRGSLEERLRMSGKTPTFQHANGASIRACAVPPRILIPRAQRLSTCISRPTASFVGIPCAVVALRGRKRGHFGKKVVEKTKKRKTPFSTTFLPKWPRLRPRSATTGQRSPTKLAVPRDMYVDRRRARGIRIRSRKTRATAR